MKILSTLFLLLAVTTTGFAQNSLNEQRAKLVRSEMNVALRDQAVNMMDMTTTEMTVFSELYNEYVVAKDELDTERRELYREYLAEVAENDGAKDEEKETAKFIGDYLKLQNEEASIEVKYFKKFTKDIDAMTMMKFFALEDQMLADVYRDRLTDTSPKFLILEPTAGSVRERLSSYN